MSADLDFRFFFRWYRAPELLYGARKYDEGVDLWCVNSAVLAILNVQTDWVICVCFQGSWMHIWRAFEQFTIISCECYVHLYYSHL